MHYIQYKAERNTNNYQQYKDDLIKQIETLNRRSGLMEDENVKLFNDKNYFKTDAEQAFLRSKDLEKVFQITVHDLKQTLESKEVEIQNMKADIFNYKKTNPQTNLQSTLLQILQATPQQALHAAPHKLLQAIPQQEVLQAAPQQEVLQATPQQVVLQQEAVLQQQSI